MTVHISQFKQLPAGTCAACCAHDCDVVVRWHCTSQRVHSGQLTHAALSVTA
jgi:hypothetical protein